MSMEFLDYLHQMIPYQMRTINRSAFPCILTKISNYINNLKIDFKGYRNNAEINQGCGFEK